MAHSMHSRAVSANLGGKHMKDDKLIVDTPANIRNNDRNGHMSDESAQKSTGHTGGRGSGQSSTEEQTNEDDEEEDSSADQDADEENDEDDDPEVVAPSSGRGLGKGKRPAIRVEQIDTDEPSEEDDQLNRGTGLKPAKAPENQALKRNKKRTFSNVSSSSVLFGETEDLGDEHAFPRRKLARKLSNTDANGLLMYQKNGTESINYDVTDNAFASSDEEDNTARAIDVDDEDYSGVNLISDESDVEQQEEQLIMKEDDMFNDSRRWSLDSSGSDNADFAATLLDENFFTEHELPDVGFGEFFDLDTQHKAPEPSRKYSDSSAKRVRFDDEVQMSESSSPSSSELDSSVFPDLFMEQDKLPRNIYQMIETEQGVDNGDVSSDGEHSYWDYAQEEHVTPTWAENALSDDFDESSDPGSSGYETDMGDTTDEYDSDSEPEMIKTPQQKSVLRRPQSAASNVASPAPYQRSTRQASTGKFAPPVCGVFFHGERNQAIAVTDKRTRLVSFYRPVMVSRRHANYIPYSSTSSTANNSPRTSIQQLQDDSDFSEIFSTPFQSTTDIMLTGVFGAAPDSNYVFGGSNFGPPEAFYPFVSVGANGNIISDEDDYDMDEDDFEDDINLADFMDFGSDADNTDVEQDLGEDTDVLATPATSMIAMNGSTPAMPEETPTSRKRTASDAMLEHFDRGVVTAFRNNQTRYRDIARLPHDPDLRASVSRPIRSGRSAETLMSPLRKRSSMPKRVRGSAAFAGVAKASNRLPSGVNGPRRGPPAGTFS